MMHGRTAGQVTRALTSAYPHVDLGDATAMQSLEQSEVDFFDRRGRDPIPPRPCATGCCCDNVVTNRTAQLAILGDRSPLSEDLKNEEGT